MITESRFQKNLAAFSEEELYKIRTKSICVVGCGGLGGNVIMSLARFGVGRLALVDDDLYRESNLNRQIFCTEENLNKNKTIEIKAALAKINSGLYVDAFPTRLDNNNAVDILSGHDIAVDCLDNITGRLALESACETVGIPFVHGAIDGFCGQVASIFPEDRLLHGLLSSEDKSFVSSSPPFISQFVAAIEAAEVLKILAGRSDVLRHKILLADLLHHTYDVVPVEYSSQTTRQ